MILTVGTESETKAPTSGGKTDVEKTERGEKTAENIRYGQKISEEGMGGQTTTSSGSANVDGMSLLLDVSRELSLILFIVAAGLGGSADDQADVGTSANSARKAQGYGGERDADKSIGA